MMFAPLLRDKMFQKNTEKRSRLLQQSRQHNLPLPLLENPASAPDSLCLGFLLQLKFTISVCIPSMLQLSLRTHYSRVQGCFCTTK